MRPERLPYLNKFAVQHNLNMHVQFYNDHKQLVSNQIANIDQELEGTSIDPKRRRDLEMAKYIYMNSYHHHMMISCFLTMYSHLEECLGVASRLFSEKKLVSKKSGLDRFREFFEAELKVKLTEGPYWSFILDCEKARNVLLHAGGNIALARNRKKTEDLVKRNKDCFSIEDSRIVPKEQLLVKFSKAISDFAEWLTDKVSSESNNPQG